MPIKLITSGGGSAILTPTSKATDYTLTVPAVTANVATDGAGFYAGYGPAFSAYLGSNQTITSGVWTKAQVGTEEFDTASCYDSTTNYRFTPNVAGYYSIQGCVAGRGTSSMNALATGIYKNGSLSKYTGGNWTFAAGSDSLINVNTLLYLNGSTDYVELWCYIAGTGTITFQGGATYLTYFHGFLARAA